MLPVYQNLCDEQNMVSITHSERLFIGSLPIRQKHHPRLNQRGLASQHLSWNGLPLDQNGRDEKISTCRSIVLHSRMLV